MGDGHLGKCKACTKDDVKRRYYDPTFRPRIIDYERRRFKDPARKEKIKGYAAGMRRRNPGKYRARTKVSNAVRDGRLVKSPCWCGSAKVEAHHTDYRKPLKVTWLCRRHHMEAEGKQHF
jgi:hypothetical protein